LAISRALARAMGGDLAVESRPGSGSRFWFDITVPVARTEEVAPLTARVVEGYEGPRRKILVVDDIPESRAFVVDFLGALGFEVHEAADGHEALFQAASVQPDLIIMDNTMPRMSGLDATRRLRELAAFKNVPIVAVSASVTEAQRQAALAAGASEFLPKPLNLDQLARALGALLQVGWTYGASEGGEGDSGGA
jgi:CheY-like chemotaxis protein